MTPIHLDSDEIKDLERKGWTEVWLTGTGKDQRYGVDLSANKFGTVLEVHKHGTWERTEMKVRVTEARLCGIIRGAGPDVSEWEVRLELVKE